MSNQKVPQPQYEYNHCIDVQLRFNDVDMLGHVNNSVYLQFMDLAKYEYFKAVMGKDFDLKALAVVVVNINCDFYSPSFINEQLQVFTTTERVGEKSLVLEQRIVSKDGDVKCVGHTIMAGYDLKTLKSAPINDNARKHLSLFEGRQF